MTFFGNLYGQLTSPFTRRKRDEDRLRLLEAARPLEDVLVAEYTALFGASVKLDDRPFEIAAADITDMQRLAEYLYEASVKDAYGAYSMSIGGDGPRIALRARIWNGLSVELRDRLERFANKDNWSKAWTLDASSLGAEETKTCVMLSEALNAIIRGEPLKEFVATGHKA